MAAGARRSRASLDRLGRLGSCLGLMNRAFDGLQRDAKTPAELPDIAAKLHAELTALHAQTADVGFAFLGGRLYAECTAVSAEASEHQLLLERLAHCRVKYLAFMKGVSAEDLLGFFRLMDDEAKRPSPEPLAGRLAHAKIETVRVVQSPPGDSPAAGLRSPWDWYKTAVAEVDGAQVRILAEQKAGIQPLTALADELITAMRATGRERFLLLPLLGRGMDPHVVHSVNVAILCCALGELHKLDFEQLRTLCTAAFLHDAGRCIVPVEWAREQARLTGFERVVVHQHSTWGFLLLGRDREIPRELAVLAAYHHSNPMRSPKGQMYEPDVFHRILHIADAYDLSVFDDRRYWRKHRQDRMLKSILRGRGRRYDPTAAKLLVNCVGYHPVGSLVRLDDGRRAVVVRPGACNPERPKVWLFEEQHFQVVDLMELDAAGLRFVRGVRDVLAPEPGLDVGRLVADNAEQLLSDSL